ncbi:hypothetical protein [Vibrio sp. Y29_XK_CS5]|uniref:hypothetical protein n=1 Tax=Vibrio sp. Y29_XK_CS5 TaxID=2957762 RepID=UPI0020A41C0F|nr:hypothetical protein [Vibrio sp. Y29_XK_CS5]
MLNNSRKIKIRYDKPVFVFSSIIYALVSRISILVAVVLILVLHVLADIEISKSGAFLAALGLLLSLKHNFIKIASNQDEAVKKSQGMGMTPYYDGVCEAEVYKKQAARETTDELTGILLVIVGGLLSSYGDVLTNWYIGFTFDRRVVLELSGFISLLISCYLFVISVPSVRIGIGNLLPHETKEQEKFVHEFAKQQANKLLGKYLLVFGLTVLMLAAFI